MVVFGPAIGFTHAAQGTPAEGAGRAASRSIKTNTGATRTSLEGNKKQKPQENTSPDQTLPKSLTSTIR